MRRALAALLLATAALPLLAQSPFQSPSTGGLAALARLERQLGTHKRVLVIGAHPDDEDTELLAWLARGEGAQAAYLSLNRGEGGQNSIGAELGDALGILRTEELLAAREVDGARQFFTRAYDFGFSRSLEDTWRQWPADTVLKDAIRVIRAFRPQVIVAVFAGTPRDGHGQHQAAGWVAREAFRVAGDPAVFPELATEEGLPAFSPRKLFRSTRFDSAATTLQVDGGRVEPSDGRTFHQLAMASRSLHRSQDMGRPQEIGGAPIRLMLVEDRTGAGGAALFAGVDTTLGAPDVGDLVRAEQQALADRADAVRRGLLLEALASDDRLLEGDSVTVRVLLAGDDLAGATLALRAVEGVEVVPQGEPREVPGGREARFVVRVRDARAGQPYFLRRPRAGALYDWPAAGSAPLGAPFEAPPLVAIAEVPRPVGRPLRLEREVTFRENRRAGGGERRRPLVTLPSVVVDAGLGAVVRPAAAATAPLAVTVRNLGRGPWAGRVRLVRADGASGAGVPVRLEAGRDTTVRVPLLPLLNGEAARYAAQAVGTDGRVAELALRDVDQPHVRRRTWLVPAVVTVRAAALTLPTVGIGYVRGPSDAVPEALQAAGVALRELDSAAVAAGRFEGLGALVIGPRAYETRGELRAAGPLLQAFARKGGTVLVQYQQPPFAQGSTPAAPLVMAGDRVTEEDAVVTVRDSAARVLRAPHPLGPADWDGWVQERGLQFARSWDPAWQAPLELHDTGQPPLAGALLVLPLERGRMIYTGLSFFRQLPAGVPGAMRLFLNLLAGGR